MNEVTSLTGRRVLLTVSEPWEFEDDNGTSRVEADVERAADGSLLLKSSKPVIAGGQSYDFLLCEPRYEGVDFTKLPSEPVHCNVKAVPLTHLSEARDLDGRWWRGGAAMIGSLELV